MIEIDGIRVDLDALLSLNHACDPGKCRYQGSCCRVYEICATRKEVSRAIGMMPAAARYARHLDEDGELANPFEPTGDGLYAIESAEDGACAFAFRRSGKLLCSIHAAALDAGLNPYRTKPSSCTLWPLALSEGTQPVLSVQEDVLRFPCNSAPRKANRALDAGVREIIGHVFGDRFLRALEDHLGHSDN
ncbi:MAG: DUF3109 family protein [Candidatus Hydrogenedentes bacterium]|nr:DUF3109 family protein [Candidatus Hydrogenedentota bacterium]